MSSPVSSTNSRFAQSSKDSPNSRWPPGRAHVPYRMKSLSGCWSMTSCFDQPAPWLPFLLPMTNFPSLFTIKTATPTLGFMLSTSCCVAEIIGYSLQGAGVGPSGVQKSKVRTQGFEHTRVRNSRVHECLEWGCAYKWLRAPWVGLSPGVGYWPESALWA